MYARGVWRWMPAGVFAVALALGLTRLGAQPLSFDEQFTRDTATLSWSGIWDAARDTEAPHFVYYALMKPWLAVFGESDWALRLPSVIFGAFAAGATAILGRRLFGELAGLVAGLALATSSYFVYWSQAARGYTLAVLLATVATYAFVRACEQRSAAWWAIWAGALAAAGWINVFAFSVVAAHVVAFLLFLTAAAAPCTGDRSLCGLRRLPPPARTRRVGRQRPARLDPDRRRPTASPSACGTWPAAIRSPCSLPRSASPPRSSRSSALILTWSGRGASWPSDARRPRESPLHRWPAGTSRGARG